MPKHGFLTPKAISNRMKSKGLQKLRWFCQACQKQCRDENGFKCHTMSESHQRQLLIIAENPNKVIDEFTREFETEFLRTLSGRHGTKRVHANLVYQEYISDKMHVHMNATMFDTLTSFVQYLGRNGKCVVDETEKGWYIQYIDKDPAAVMRQKELEKKRQAAMDDDERMQKFIKQQVAAAQAASKEEDENVSRELKRESDEKLVLSLATADAKKAETKKAKPAIGSFSFTSIVKTPDEDESKPSDKTQTNGGSKVETGKRKSAMEELMEEEKRRKLSEQLKAERKDYWLWKNIIVKVINKKLADGRYYKKKGVVTRVEEKYIAHLKMLDSGDVLKIDQDDLETVIPAKGYKVQILNGVGRGQVAELLELQEEKFSARLRIADGRHRGKVVENVAYEDFCKLDPELYP